MLVTPKPGEGGSAASKENAGGTPLQLRSSHQLLVNCFRLRFGKELLKSRIVANWIPDGVDL